MDLRIEADRLLYEKGLVALLAKYGKVHPVGSYRMRLMSWCDIDISVENDRMTTELFYLLSYQLNELLMPIRFEGAIHTQGHTFFLGIETEVTGQRWNIDLQIHTRCEIIKTEAFCDEVNRRVAQDARLGDAILMIKKELIKQHLYGMDKQKDRHYHSMDIYKAVLDEGVRTIDEFIQKYPI